MNASTAPSAPAWPPTEAVAPLLRHRSFAVLGAGRSGTAAAALLLDAGRKVTLYDDFAADDAPGLRELAARGARLCLRASGSEPLDAEAMIVSPGVGTDHPLIAAARRAGLPVRGELELGWQCRGGARMAAVTGTNGKTTVTMLLHALMEAAGRPARAVGNIGFALCEAVRQDRDRLAGMHYACEVSSFQLETIEHFAPEVALVLNVTPDHLDRHRDMPTYADLKGRITENQGPGQVLVVNQDDPWCLRIAARSRARVRRFSLEREVDDGAWLDGDLLMLARPGAKPARLLAMSELAMIGLHNVANALAAAAAADALGIDRKTIAAVLAAFRAAPHRLEHVATIDGVAYIDDSKATNLDAMRRALESFSGGIHLIAGGRDKASPLHEVAELLAKRVRTVYLIGEAAAPMLAAWGARVECLMCGTLERALEAASARAVAGDVVLLSPGCASFDQFRSYAHRGEVFAAWVRARAAQRGAAPADDAPEAP